MGREVQGVPRGARLVESASTSASDPSAALDPGSFGSWLRFERELRGVSRFYVAARLKLPAERIAALEQGRERLAQDGRGRALARALADAIGADPSAALRALGPRAASTPRPRRARPLPSLRVLLGVLFLGAALLGSGLAASWLLASDPAEETSPRVYRRDYVDELFE